MTVFIWPLAYSQPVTFRAAGDARFPMVIAIGSMFICRIAMSYLPIGRFDMGVFGSYAAMFIDWTFKAVIFSIHYMNHKWMRFRLT